MFKKNSSTMHVLCLFVCSFVVTRVLVLAFSFYTNEMSFGVLEEL